MQTKQSPTVEVKGIRKNFLVGEEQSEVLKGIDLTIDFGEFVIIFGPSGCGKSTLLNTMLGLERPTSGSVSVRGQDIYSMSEDKRAAFRLQKFGVVYQQPNWIRSLNVIENVAFPLNIAGMSNYKAMKKAKEILYLFNLDRFEKYYPMELSGGQQQKLSTCRALITNPWIILADEPTGNLDTATAADLMCDFKVLNEESKRTIIMVTHNLDYERYATKVVYMEDGMIKRIERKKMPSFWDKSNQEVTEVV